MCSYVGKRDLIVLATLLCVRWIEAIKCVISKPELLCTISCIIYCDSINKVKFTVCWNSLFCKIMSLEIAVLECLLCMYCCDCWVSGSQLFIPLFKDDDSCDTNVVFVLYKTTRTHKRSRWAKLLCIKNGFNILQIKLSSAHITKKFNKSSVNFCFYSFILVRTRG